MRRMFPGKCAKNLTFFSQFQLKMEQKNFKKDLLVQNVLDASVNFQANGNILVMPCPWESDKQVTNGERVHYRGGVEVDADGRTRVKRYNEGTGPKHDVLYETPHGAVKATRPWFRKTSCGRHKAGERILGQEQVYFMFKFPKKYGRNLIMSLFREEADKVLSYLNTREEETIW